MRPDRSMPFDAVAYTKRNEVLRDGKLAQEHASSALRPRTSVRSSSWRFFLRDDDGGWADLPERYSGTLIGAQQRCFELSISLGAPVNADQVQATIAASMSYPVVASGPTSDDNDAARYIQASNLGTARLIERAEHAV